MKKCIIFSHTDLDGVSGVIVGRRIASNLGLEPEYYMCNYHDVNDIIENRLNKGIFGVSLIIIVDISVNEDVALLLNEINKYTDTTVNLVDHHSTAEWLNKYEWASVHEKVDGIERCGTYQLASLDLAIFSEMEKFVSLVDDWDTWKWTTNGNELAKKINSLYQIIGKDKFIEYFESTYYNNKPLFNSWANTIIEAHEMAVNKSAKSCENSMWITKLQVKGYSYKCGIIFVNNDISDVADIILNDIPELDVLMCVGLPRNISFRTKKTLEVPLGDIAKLMTGSGGGHPQAAGCVLDKNQFRVIASKLLNIPKHDSITFSELDLLEDTKCVE